jgi:hypothetical protein
MKKSKRVSERRPAAKRAWLFACALLFAGVATAAATYASRNSPARPEAAPAAAAAAQPADPYVTVEVGGRKLRVNAQALQKGPLTQEEARQLSEQLEGNKATEGLVQEKHKDGTVSVYLQGRFQNVTMARRNDDGTVSAACVDTPEAARAFLSHGRAGAATPDAGGDTGSSGKAGLQQ